MQKRRDSGAEILEKIPFGTRLKVARLKRGLSLRSVEIQTGLSNSYLSQLENGHFNNPGVGVAVKLANFYGVSLEELTRPETVPGLEDVKIKMRAFRDLFGQPIHGDIDSPETPEGLAEVLTGHIDHMEDALADARAHVEQFRRRLGVSKYTPGEIRPVCVDCSQYLSAKEVKAGFSYCPACLVKTIESRTK